MTRSEASFVSQKGGLACRNAWRVTSERRGRTGSKNVSSSKVNHQCVALRCRATQASKNCDAFRGGAMREAKRSPFLFRSLNPIGGVCMKYDRQACEGEIRQSAEKAHRWKVLGVVIPGKPNFICKVARGALNLMVGVTSQSDLTSVRGQ